MKPERLLTLRRLPIVRNGLTTALKQIKYLPHYAKVCKRIKRYIEITELLEKTLTCDMTFEQAEDAAGMSLSESLMLSEMLNTNYVELWAFGWDAKGNMR